MGMVKLDIINLPCREITMTYCNPPSGGFAIEKEANRLVNWDHCREQFAVRFLEKTEGFYFCHKACEADSVTCFLNKFENILSTSEGCDLMEKTQFAHTNQEKVLYVKPSSFWKDCFFKRSLFTILARCSQNYLPHKDNFDEALFSPNFKESTYTYETKPAVLRFMFGFTKYTGISPVTAESTVVKHGWKEEFYKLDESEIRNRLVLPDGVKKKCNIVGSDSLWGS